MMVLPYLVLVLSHTRIYLLIPTFVLENTFVERIPRRHGSLVICAAFWDGKGKDFGALVPGKVVGFLQR